ncbi:MAG: hypothetical protein VKS61_10935 [Candidatus Sericytochromatia bacterium]|nr:hypothetical protein [Candidatus Sericytochromatia bacterium]
MSRPMLRSLVALALTATCLEAALVACGAPAMAAGSLAGAWVYEPRDSDDVEAAINTAADKVNFVIRGLAAGRLRNTNKPYHRIEISQDQHNTTVKTDTRGAVKAPSSGAPAKWTRADKQVYDVVMTWRSERRLEEAFTNAEGKRVNVYELRPGGQAMDMRVTVSSPKLPVPLTYRLGYHRMP